MRTQPPRLSISQITLSIQGNCLEGEHSLHVTLSAYQLNSWTDLLEKLLPAALAVAAQENVEYRQVSVDTSTSSSSGSSSGERRVQTG